MWLPRSQMGSQLLGFVMPQPYGVYPFHCFKKGTASCYSFSCPPGIPPIWWSRQLSWFGRKSANPSAIPTWQGGVFFSRLFSTSNVMANSVVGVKPGDSGMVIGYQVDEFTCTWSSEFFIAQSHIYSEFMARYPFLRTSHLNQAVRITPFRTTQSKTLNMVLSLSLQTLSIHQNCKYPLMRLLPCQLKAPMLGEYPF